MWRQLSGRGDGAISATAGDRYPRALAGEGLRRGLAHAGRAPDDQVAPAAYPEVH